MTTTGRAARRLVRTMVTVGAAAIMVGLALGAAGCTRPADTTLAVTRSGIETGWWVVLVVEADGDVRPLSESPPTGGAEADVPPPAVFRFNADILFATGSSEITGDPIALLAEVAASIAESGAAVVVMGHTDDVGSDASNERLAIARSDSVAAVLVDQLAVPADLVATDGRGETCPIADNATAAGRAANRRVEIFEVGDEPPCD